MTKCNLIIETASLICLAIAVLVTLFSLCRFKDILVKFVATEILVNLFICGIGIWTVYIQFPPLLDICIALSLIMFLSTVAYCQLLTTQKNT